MAVTASGSHVIARPAPPSPAGLPAPTASWHPAPPDPQPAAGPASGTATGTGWWQAWRLAILMRVIDERWNAVGTGIFIPCQRSPPVNDSWIAATAIAHGVPVVTQDSDYDAMPDVRVIKI
jgi:hypothetical protein